MIILATLHISATTDHNEMKRKLSVVRRAVTEMFSAPPTGNEDFLRSSAIDKLLNDSPCRNKESVSAQVDNLYLPIFKYICGVVNVATSQKNPVFIGISAAQGAGKTTLTTTLRHLFQLEHKRCEILSLDDFYLTADEQLKFAEAHSGNPLLQYRGNAGTHDLDLLQRTLQELDALGNDTSASTCRIPRYDKSLREGRGDRAPVEDWTLVNGRVDVVLLEGWMLGFTACATEAECSALSENMKEVNAYLHGYKRLHFLMDAWLVIDAEDVDYVYRWRQEAETKMRNSGKSALNDMQVKDFVDRFMPAYETYLPALRQCGPERRTQSESVEALVSCPVLQVCVGFDRLPLTASTRY